jgi:AcrR family transcriptional regulator
MPPNDQKDTKERILDAAERLFSESGFSGTSLRNITAEAGVNLAAVNYHFGSKEGLIEEVFSRRLGPMNRERIALLDALEARGTTNDPCLGEIVEAFVGPPLRLSADPELGGLAFMRLLGHAMTQPSARIRLLLTSQFRDVGLRFVSAIRRAVPELSEAEAVWRVLFMAGAMGHALAFGEQVTEMYGDLVGDRGEQTLARRLVPFLAEGLRAPAAKLETEGAQ